MPNNPVQIILNDRDFHQAPDPGQPPRNKDFFEGADREFAAHKATLLASVDRIIEHLAKSPNGPAAYLKVQMRNEALAKSYRPVHWCRFAFNREIPPQHFQQVSSALNLRLST